MFGYNLIIRMYNNNVTSVTLSWSASERERAPLRVHSTFPSNSVVHVRQVDRAIDISVYLFIVGRKRMWEMTSENNKFSSFFSR